MTAWRAGAASSSPPPLIMKNTPTMIRKKVSMQQRLPHRRGMMYSRPAKMTPSETRTSH